MPNGETYLKKINPKTNKEVILNLKDLNILA